MIEVMDIDDDTTREQRYRRNDQPLPDIDIFEASRHRGVVNSNLDQKKDLIAESNPRRRVEHFYSPKSAKSSVVTESRTRR
jgi:hypothetical protein